MFKFLYDETVTHNDPVTQTVDYGTFIFKDENNNIQIKEWGDPIRKDNLKSHWEIGENLNLFDSIKINQNC